MQRFKAIIQTLFVTILFLVIVFHPSPSFAKGGPIDVVSPRSDYTINIDPVSKSWTLPDKFTVKNKENFTIYLHYHLDCWPEWEGTVCNDVTTTITLDKNESVNLGFGLICAKWQLDMDWDSSASADGDTDWDWGGISEMDCSGVTPSPTLIPTITPIPLPSDTPIPGATLTPTPTPGPTSTPGPTPTPTPASGYVINGVVFVDTNRDGIYDATEVGYSGAKVTLSTGATRTSASSGNYSFNNTPSGTYTVQLTVPVGYGATTATSGTVTIGPNDTVDFGIAPQYTISGNLYVDMNNNGVKDVGETDYQNATMTLSGAASATTTTDASGNYTFANLFADTYLLTLTVPARYMATTTNPQSVVIGPNTTANFGIIPVYTVTGNVFSDVNKNQLKDGGESNYTGSAVTISSSGGSVSVSNGAYTVINLIQGTYTISYTSPLPTGFQLVYPKNGPPPSFVVTVGPGCTTDTTTGASCTAQQDIINLNFSISDAIPWVQTSGLDARFDPGVTNYIAATPACSGPYALTNGSSSNPGVLFVGDTAPNYGYGSSSSTKQVVGGAGYPEVYKSTKGNLSSSYSSLLALMQKSSSSIIDIQSLNGCSNLSNCSLPNNLDTGIYQANGDVVLHNNKLKNNSTYIFLINGTLTITENVQVPQGSSLIVTAARDIVVDAAVGTNPRCDSNSSGIEGLYSADRNFIIQGINNCVNGTDEMLFVRGTTIVNAALNGGTFQNNRDLCAANRQYPSVMFQERPDMILNAPDIVKRKSFIYQEVAP